MRKVLIKQHISSAFLKGISSVNKNKPENDD